MAKDLTEALDSVEMTYSQIVDIANNMLSDLITPVNELMGELGDNIENLTTEQIRQYIVRIQLKAYEISETRDKSQMKAALATALQKEKFAEKFNAADGTAAVKNNIALIQSSEATIVEALYELVADMLKTKLDSLHRMVDALKSVLMSRMQEAKLTQNVIE